MHLRRLLIGVALVSLAVASLPAAPWKKGDKLEVSWGGGWYPAEVLDVEGARYKIRYDGYGSAWDEWATAERLRDPKAPAASIASPPDGSPAPAPAPASASPAATETFAFPARPAGATAGLDGVWLRVESIFLGTSLSIRNEGWFFTPGGRVSRSPKGGFDPGQLATAARARRSDGVYWLANGKLVVSWAGGARPTEYAFARKGAELVISGIGATPVEGMPKGWRADVAYEGGASIGGGAVASSTTIIFRRDGTYSRDSIGSLRSDGRQVDASAYARASEAGRYEFDGYTLTLTQRDGSVSKHTVFAFSDRDGQGAPEYLWREGGMMSRQ